MPSASRQGLRWRIVNKECGYVYWHVCAEMSTTWCQSPSSCVCLRPLSCQTSKYSQNGRCQIIPLRRLKSTKSKNDAPKHNITTKRPPITLILHLKNRKHLILKKKQKSNSESICRSPTVRHQASTSVTDVTQYIFHFAVIIYMHVRLGLTVWQIGHESCGWPPVTWPQSATSAAYLAARGASIPPPRPIATCGCVHVSLCFPAKDMMSSSCYESDESCPSRVLRTSGQLFASAGRISYVCLPLSSSSVLFLSFLPIQLWEHTAWSRSALLEIKLSLLQPSLQAYVCVHEGRLWNAGGATHALFVGRSEM